MCSKFIWVFVGRKKYQRINGSVNAHLIVVFSTFSSNAYILSICHLVQVLFD